MTTGTGSGKIESFLVPLLDHRAPNSRTRGIKAIVLYPLCAIFRTQFGVLRKYERVMQMDANGRQVSNEVLKDVAAKGARAHLGRYERPFTGVDRAAEMTTAHTEFTRRLAARPPRLVP